jgi:5-methylcytosine-specific restriction endonuclease McrA
MKRGGGLRRTPMKRTARNTGPTDTQRAAVIHRAEGRCERCGTEVAWTAWSIHHRLPRGRGGQNRLSNLALLCGSATTPGGCHLFVESQREQAYDTGWLVRTGMDPATVPLVVTGRGLVFLTDDGTYLGVT